MILWAANNWALVSTSMAKANLTLETLSVAEYLNWVEATMMDGLTYDGREAVIEYLYALPEVSETPDELSPEAAQAELKRRMETWGMGSEAEEGQREMMKLAQTVNKKARP